MSRSQLFIGRLPMDIREKDVEDVFEKYGHLLRCDVKYGKGMYGSVGRRGSGRTGMAYAFVDFEDRRDAEDAIKYENGRELRGQSIVVEWARGPSSRSRDNSGYQRNSSYRSSEECYCCRRTGHWARDCPESDRGGRGGDRYHPRSRRSRSRSRSDRRRRSPSRSRSRSNDRRRRSPSPYQRAEKSRSVSRDKRVKQRSPSRSVTPKSISRSRSRSPDKPRRKPEKSARKKVRTPSKSPVQSRSPHSRSQSRSPSFQRNADSRSPDNYVEKADHAGRRSISKDNTANYDNDYRSVSRSQSR